MTKIQAVQCNGPGCSAIVLEEDATEVVEQFKGPRANGRRVRHLCNSCVDAAVGDPSTLRNPPGKKKPAPAAPVAPGS